MDKYQGKTIKNLNPKRLKINFSKKLKLHKMPVILILIIIVGAIFRINGVGFGLPLKLHPDEGAIIKNAVTIADSGNLNPKLFHWPAHVSIYLNALFYKSYSVVRSLLFRENDGIRTQFEKNHSPYVYLSRLITACLGSLMILSMFLIGKEVGGQKVGLLSSAFTAFFTSFIRHSHYVTPDIPLAFYISMVALFTCKYMKKRRVVFLFLACFFSALATAEKYPGIISLIIIFFGVIFSHKRKKKDILKLLPLSGIAFLSSLFVVSPYLFLKYQRVIGAVVDEARPYHIGVERLGWGGNLLYYLGTLVDNLGVLLGLFFLWGLVLFFIKFKATLRAKPYLTISLFGLFYWVLHSKVAIHWERWAVPMYIVPIFITSVGIERLSFYLKKKNSGWSLILKIFLAIVLVSLFCRGMMQSLNFNWKDTRLVSKQWISLNLPANSKMAADAYSPLNPDCCDSVASKSLEEFKNEGVEYVIVSSFVYQRILDEKENYPFEAAFYTRLFKDEYLVKEFTAVNVEVGVNDFSAVYKSLKEFIRYLRDRDLHLRGPVIRIYKISEEEKNLPSETIYSDGG